MLRLRGPQNELERWAFEYMTSIQDTKNGRRLIAIVCANNGQNREIVEHCLNTESTDEAWARAQRLLGLTDADAETAGPIVCD